MCALTLTARAFASSLPVSPRSLVIQRAALPGFAAAHTEIESTASPADWTQRILEDTPASGAREKARLVREGFREGALEALAVPGGLGFSGTLLLGSPMAARRETRLKASEEQHELGVGTKRFAIRALPHAVGLEQERLPGIPGRDWVSVTFSERDCTVSVGAVLGTSAAPRSAAIAGAVALHRKLSRVCVS